MMRFIDVVMSVPSCVLNVRSKLLMVKSWMSDAGQEQRRDKEAATAGRKEKLARLKGDRLRKPPKVLQQEPFEGAKEKKRDSLFLGHPTLDLPHRMARRRQLSPKPDYFAQTSINLRLSAIPVVTDIRVLQKYGCNCVDFH